MDKYTPEKKVIPVLKNAVYSILKHKVIMFPYCITAFVHFLVLEILYFANRFPFSDFFDPIIRKLWSENYLHYPLNFVLLPKLFQYAQFIIYIFINNFLIAVSISIINNINSNLPIDRWNRFKETLSSYIHIVVIATISFFFIFIFFKVYGMVLDRAFLIRSQTGFYYILKNLVIYGAPYINLLLSIIITALFAYVIPIIIIDKKKVFSAILLNFKSLWQAPWFTFLIVFIPTMLYVPVLLLRNIITIKLPVPELTVLNLVLTVLVMIIIDAIVFTSITSYYLVTKEK